MNQLLTGVPSTALVEGVKFLYQQANLRDLLEVVLQSPIILAGGPPRTLEITDVDVLVRRGVRTDLAQLHGSASIRRVRVHSGDVDSGGDVTGVQLT